MYFIMIPTFRLPMIEIWLMDTILHLFGLFKPCNSGNICTVNGNNMYRIMYIKSMLSTCFSDNFIVSVPGSMQRLSLKALTCHSGIRKGCAGIAAKTTCCSGWGHCTPGTQGMLQPMGRLFLTFVWEIRILLFIETCSCPLTCQIYTALFCTDVKQILQNFAQ